MPFTCLNCLGEPTLRERAVPFCIHQTECTYCSATGSHADIKDIAEIFLEVFETHFQETSNDGDSFNNDQFPDGENYLDIIQELGEVPEPLAKDVGHYLEFYWRENSHFFSFANFGPYFKLTETNFNHISKMWESLKWKIQLNRFYNEEVKNELDEYFRDITNDTDSNGDPVIVQAGPESEIRSVFRARYFQSIEAAEKSLSSPEREFGRPPDGFGGPGRMNAQGQSVFYCATDPATTIAEVRPPVGSIVVVVKFDLLRPLRLLDLNRLQSINLPEDFSLFDPNAIRLVKRRDFLSQLENLISMPVLPNNQNADYLITQVISDYLAYNKSLQLDGIIYRSVQDNNRENRNIVIFSNSCLVKNCKYNHDTAKVNLLITENNGVLSISPKIKFIEQSENEIKVQRKNLSLTLDQEQIKIHLVKGVSYMTEVFPTIFG